MAKATDEQQKCCNKKIISDTYENKQERPIRVMVKNLYRSCKPTKIVDDLRTKGFKAVDAVNKLKWKTKDPLENSDFEIGETLQSEDDAWKSSSEEDDNVSMQEEHSDTERTSSNSKNSDSDIDVQNDIKFISKSRFQWDSLPPKSSKRKAHNIVTSSRNFKTGYNRLFIIDGSMNPPFSTGELEGKNYDLHRKQSNMEQYPVFYLIKYASKLGIEVGVAKEAITASPKVPTREILEPGP
ncbi:hypothetical protein FQA39_LY06741 [Lamprigera yunnana]|nr:hypothetical protein FQA39_LY06741 [Lamprigera yunnana]